MQCHPRTPIHRRWLGGALALVALFPLPAVGVPIAEEPASEESEVAPAVLEAPEIARRAEDVLRGDRTYMEATVTVASSRSGRPRAVSFHVWEDRVKGRCFLRIFAPAKEAGKGFLWLPPNLWTYLPRDERTTRLPLSVMIEPWMGSDFTNDDLFHASNDVDDYEQRLLGVDESAEGHEGPSAYVLESSPREEGRATWGRIVSWIEVEYFTPLRRDFYDEDGVRRRSLRFEDIRQVGVRRVPHLWIMTPLDGKGHESRLQLDRIVFDVSFDDEIFSARNLRKR